VCSFHQIDLTWLPRRSARKHRIQGITVGLFSFYLLQRWLGWCRCRHALTPVAADTARLGSSTRWLGDHSLLPVFRDARSVPRLCSLADALTRGRLSRLGFAERSPKPCDALWTSANCVSIRRFLMSQSRTSRRSDLAPCRLPTELLPTTWLVVLDLVFTCCWSTWFFGFDNWVILLDWLLVIDWSSSYSSAALYRASRNRYFPFAHGPQVICTPGPTSKDPFWPICPRPTESNVLALSCWSSYAMCNAGAPSSCWDVAHLLVQSPRQSPKSGAFRYFP